MLLNNSFFRCFFLIVIYGSIGSLSFLNAQTFERIESYAGLDILKENNGVSIADYDNDGDLDLFVVARAQDMEGVVSSHSRLFSNNNDGTFTDVTEVSGLINLFPVGEVGETSIAFTGFKFGAFWGDYDNDGFPDLFMTHTNKMQLFHNLGDGTFKEVTVQAGFKKYNDCINTGATWFDYNKDGFLDIYISDWDSDCEGNRLYKNNGNGTFTDVSSIFQGVTSKHSYQSIPFDFNDDGWLDLYVTNDFIPGANDLFINNHGTSFTEAAASYGVDSSRGDMGMAIGDYNNDGFFDIYITTIGSNLLYTKTENATYVNVARDLNVVNTGWAWDATFSDFDLDRDEDLFVVNGFDYYKPGYDKNVYFENLLVDGGNGFVESSQKTGLGEITISVGAGVFDFDNDGDLDLFVTNNDRPSYFYENKSTDFIHPSEDLHWFKVKLEGTISNRDAIGTKVSIKTAKGSLHRYYTGKGFLSQNLRPVHFGLGADTEILELKIIWPSGIIETYTNIPADKTILAKEGNGFEILNIAPSIKIYGCTDPKSCNYNVNASVDTGKCKYLVSGFISGNRNSFKNSTDQYSYSPKAGGVLEWRIDGGEILEAPSGNGIKVKWGTGSVGKVYVVESNDKCLSQPIELSVTLLNENETVAPKSSVARLWNEVLLAAIRKDYARPTVHARNLFHTSVVMYDAWAVFDTKAQTYLLGKEVHGFKSEFNGFTTTENTVEARNKAISYAAYRLLSHRFSKSPDQINAQANFDALMVKLGYDIANTSVDYSTADAAALGNYIAQTVIDYGLVDGSNEINQYKNIFYQPVNDPLNLLNPEEYSITTIDPNRWQPLKFDSFIDQSGNLIPGSTPSFLSPEWGNVYPFSLKDSDKNVLERLGNSYNVYHNPGDPPFLSLDQNSKSSQAYKWGFSLVSKWSSHLDPKDGVRIDISPKSLGNIDSSLLPKSYLEYPNFYDAINGGDIGKGYAVNPYTKQPYVEQKVLRGDYTRVLAEFWADGPNSETPPGHWFSILNYVSDNKLFKKRFNGQGKILNDLEWDVKSYFVLGGAMHDCAITAWGIKGWYDYIRPISAIRYMAAKGQSTDPNLPNYNVAGMPLEPGFIEIIHEGDPLAGPNNENLGKIKLYAWKAHSQIKDPNADVAGTGWILAENWWPYQRPSFVTPPFAGYISGHSTYSRAGAEIMTMLTGDAYFPGGMGEFIAHKNEFLVFEEGPSEDVKLQWATYRDASDQCSLSRIWGGIHPPQDDIPGRLIGEIIGEEAFAFSITYFNGQVGAIQNEGLEVLAYPNPVYDELTIDSGSDIGDKGITFYDMRGNVVLFQTSSGSVSKLSVEALPSAVYLLKVSNGQKENKTLIIKK